MKEIRTEQVKRETIPAWRIADIFNEHQQIIYKRTDRIFAVLMVIQWLAGIAAAYWISPKTWAGTTSQTHLHVWAAIFLGGAISFFPTMLALVRPGCFSTRYTVAVGQMLMGALLIHLTGGRIETHFHVFGSLAFLSFYRDWRVLVPATLIVAADHFLRGLFWPQSVYGVVTASQWRWLEHAGWVLFEDTFLFIAIKHSINEMWKIAERTAEIKSLNTGLEHRVAERTVELAAVNQGLEKEVAERKLAEEASRNSEAHYRLLFESNPFPMWVYDLETLSFLAVNESAVHRYGYSREEFLAMTIKDIRPAEDVPAPLDNVSKVFSGLDDSGTWRHRKKDGTIIDVEIISYPLSFDGRRAELVLASDVTERKRAEANLRESEERYRHLFHDDLTGDFISTPDGQLLECNMAFARMFGFASIEEAMACNLVSIYPNQSARAALMERLRREKRLEYCEIELRRVDGTTVYAVETIIGTFDEQGTLVGMRGYIFDDTRRKELEDQLRQSQKMEAIGMLAGGMAHDFNNLLTVINGHTELSLRRLNQDDLLYCKLETIKEAGERASSLTRQLLAFSRKQILQPKVLDLNKVIFEMNKMLQRLIGEDIDLLIGLAPDLGRVKADPGQIEQVLMNLSVNARDAMPKGGKLTIETANVEIDEGYANRHLSIRPGRYVMLAVSDTGCGMDAQTQERIFEPFFTTKGVGKGTGLGLSTVYGIVTQSGGHVGAYSEVGRGTTFKIYLPCVNKPVEEFKTSADDTQVLTGTETVLLVEDEEMVRNMTKEILQESGYQVLEAKHGHEALLIAEQHHGPIHLMLSDVVMPQMSGRELAQQLTPLRREMKVLYMSGYTDDAIVHHGVLDEGMAFIEKPFTANALTCKLRELLNAPVEV